MTKTQKELNNRYALDLWNMINSMIKQGTVICAWEKRLAYCKADVICYEYKNEPVIYLLRSYNTIVAGVIVNTGAIYGIDMLRYVYRYTATSAQHIAKFFSHYVGFKSRVLNKEEYRLRYYK